MKIPRKKVPLISEITEYLIDSCVEEKIIVDKALRILSINSIYDYMYIVIYGMVQETLILYPTFNGDAESIDMIRISKRVQKKHFTVKKILSEEDGEILAKALTFVGKLLINWHYHNHKNEPDYEKSQILIERGIDEYTTTSGANEEERNEIKNGFLSTVQVLKLHDAKLSKLKGTRRIETSKIRFIWISGIKYIKSFFSLLTKYELIEKDYEKFSSLFIVDGKPLNNSDDKIKWCDKETSPTQITYLFHKLCPDFIYSTQSKNINTILRGRIIDAGGNSTFLSNIDKLYSKVKNSPSNKSEKIQQADTIIRALKEEYNKAQNRR